jgi:hypothetical protein
MKIDIDKIVSEISGWDFQIIANGKTFDTAEPDGATAQKVVRLSSAESEAALADEMSQAIAALIPSIAPADNAALSLAQKATIISAVGNYAKSRAPMNANKISAAVEAAINNARATPGGN